MNNGKIKFNEDGTFQYIPDKGFSGKDTFEYNVVLVIDGKEYIKSAKVTINVILSSQRHHQKQQVRRRHQHQRKQ
ncbi:MAG: Ig-like domain-containing protein [Lachnospira eligens]